MFIDAKSKTIRAVRTGGVENTASIERVLRLPNAMAINGIQGTTVWSMLVAEDSGNATISAARNGRRLYDFWCMDSEHPGQIGLR